MKTASKVSISVLTICLFLIGAYFSFASTAFNMKSFEKQFEKNNTYEFVKTEKDALMRIMTKTMDFLRGKTDSMQSTEVIDGELQEVFYDDELAHMEDVKNVFSGVQNFFFCVSFLAVALLIFLFCKKKMLTKNHLNIALGTLFSILIAVGILGVIASTNFDEAFVVFHEIFFPQGNWQFPESSFMIRMLPETLFFDFALQIIITMASILVVFVVATLVLKKFLPTTQTLASVPKNQQ